MEEKVLTLEPTESASTKKRREDKIRKRDPRAWDNICKLLNTLPDTEKFEAASKKYVELYDEFRKVSQNCQNLERNYALLQKEKEQIRAEQGKSILARSRLENLCRELQKQNKQIKEENMVKIKEEEERRKEVAAKFQKTLDEVTSMMNENREKNFKLRDDNIDMSKKISELYEEFQKREEDIKRMAKQMDLEKQLSKATITKLEFELKAEKELWAKERDILQGNLEQSETRNKHLLENIKGMEEHLSVYKGQYEDFESTLDKSNKFFDNCKSEMVKMSKHIHVLEKEVTNWKSKWQASATTLIELSTTKQAQDSYLAAADRKIDQLQKLCRQLQVDRASFLKLLKANGIEPVSQPCIENTERPPTPSSTPKEKELGILKDKLKSLQDQLRTSLTVESNGSTNENENVEVSTTKIGNTSNSDQTEVDISVSNTHANVSENNSSTEKEDSVINNTFNASINVPELISEDNANNAYQSQDVSGMDADVKTLEICDYIVTNMINNELELQEIQSDSTQVNDNVTSEIQNETLKVLEIPDQDSSCNTKDNIVSEENIANGGEAANKIQGNVGLDNKTVNKVGVSELQAIQSDSTQVDVTSQAQNEILEVSQILDQDSSCNAEGSKISEENVANGGETANKIQDNVGLDNQTVEKCISKASISESQPLEQ